MVTNPHVSYFSKGIDSRIPKNSLPLNNVLQTIKSGNYNIEKRITDLRKEVDGNGNKTPRYSFLKKYLPAFTPSGCFDERKKNVEVSNYSYFTILDIDDLTKESLVDIQEKVKDIPEVYAGFVSPGGFGYKILVRIDSAPEHHDWATRQLMIFFEKILNVKVDPSGKDITRLCFLSFDPEIYINENPKIYNVTLETPIEKRKEKAIKFTEKKILFAEGARNTFTFHLGCNLNRFGISEPEAIELTVNKYEETGFDSDEIELIIKSCYENNVNENGKWKNYNDKPKSIEYSELDAKRISDLEDEMGLSGLSISEKEIAEIIISILEDDTQPFLELLAENLDAIKNEIDDSVDGGIIKLYIANNSEDVDFFKNYSDSEISSRVVKIIEEESFDFSKNTEYALRIAILRFKVSKTKTAYDKLSKSIIHQPFTSITKIQDELSLLSKLHNSWVKQIKSLFTSFEESRL